MQRNRRWGRKYIYPENYLRHAAEIFNCAGGKSTVKKKERIAILRGKRSLLVTSEREGL